MVPATTLRQIWLFVCKTCRTPHPSSRGSPIARQYLKTSQ